MTDLYTPVLRLARESDWGMIRTLLSESGLPTEDLDTAALDGFLVAVDGVDLAGLIGLQLYGTVGLLRSLVVAKGVRRRGLGGKLVGALESAAEVAGVTELWLITVDAQDFFLRYGFELMERNEAPASIQQSEEFRELCPGTASLMRKSIAS